MTMLEAWRICEWFFELVGMLTVGFVLCLFAVICFGAYADSKAQWPREPHKSFFRDYK